MPASLTGGLSSFALNIQNLFKVPEDTASLVRDPQNDSFVELP